MKEFLNGINLENDVEIKDLYSYLEDLKAQNGKTNLLSQKI
jgi:hypothetical protein